MSRRLAVLFGLVAIAIGAARLADPVGPPRRGVPPELAQRLAATGCTTGTVVAPGGQIRPLGARPSADGGALDQVPTQMANALNTAGLGPIRSSRIARGWPTPETPLCVLAEPLGRGFTSDGGLLMDRDGHTARWHPWFARTDPAPTGERIRDRLADAWWLALLIGLLVLGGGVARRRAPVAAWAPTVGAALAVALAAGL